MDVAHGYPRLDNYSVYLKMSSKSINTFFYNVKIEKNHGSKWRLPTHTSSKQLFFASFPDCHEHFVASWLRHEIETFSALLALCEGDPPVTGGLWGGCTGDRWIPLTKANDAERGCFLLSLLNKRLRKQSRRQWFKTPSRSLCRLCNGC